jgi:hypothetical protein
VQRAICKESGLEQVACLDLCTRAQPAVQLRAANSFIFLMVAETAQLPDETPYEG